MNQVKDLLCGTYIAAESVLSVMHKFIYEASYLFKCVNQKVYNFMMLGEAGPDEIKEMYESARKEVGARKVKSISVFCYRWTLLGVEFFCNFNDFYPDNHESR